MHHRIIMSVVVLGTLTACGGHGLDSPLSTCKSVTHALAGGHDLVWHKESQTEKSGEEIRVTLELSLAGQEQAGVSQVVCIYGPNSDDMDYNSMFGEYANTPSTMLINGQPVPTSDLMQAVNLATLNTAKAISADVAARTQAALNRLNGR